MSPELPVVVNDGELINQLCLSLRFYGMFLYICHYYTGCLQLMEVLEILQISLEFDFPARNTGNPLEFRDISWNLVSPRRYFFLMFITFNYRANRIAVISGFSNPAQ